MPLLNPNSKPPTLQTPPRLSASAGNPSAISHRSPVKCAAYFTGPSSTLVSRPSTGFTLIELLVVMTIIGILAALAFYGMGEIQKKSARAKAESEIKALSAAIEEFHRDFGQYPAENSTSLLRELLGSNAVINSIPGRAKVYFEPAPGIVSTNTAGQPFFQDPWGAAYIFRTSPAGLRNRGLFDLYSTAGGTDPSAYIWNSP